jgi:hypothetical protein
MAFMAADDPLPLAAACMMDARHALLGAPKHSGKSEIPFKSQPRPRFWTARPRMPSDE